MGDWVEKEREWKGREEKEDKFEEGKKKWEKEKRIWEGRKNEEMQTWKEKRKINWLKKKSE